MPSCRRDRAAITVAPVVSGGCQHAANFTAPVEAASSRPHRRVGCTVAERCQPSTSERAGSLEQRELARAARLRNCKPLGTASSDPHRQAYGPPKASPWSPRGGFRRADVGIGPYEKTDSGSVGARASVTGYDFRRYTWSWRHVAQSVRRSALYAEASGHTMHAPTKGYAMACPRVH